jgi:hypothetical protein
MTYGSTVLAGGVTTLWSLAGSPPQTRLSTMQGTRTAYISPYPE